MSARVEAAVSSSTSGLPNFEVHLFFALQFAISQVGIAARTLTRKQGSEGKERKREANPRARHEP